MFRSILNSYDSRIQSYTQTTTDNMYYTIYTGTYELCDKYKYIYLSILIENLQSPSDTIKIYYTHNITGGTITTNYTDTYNITTQLQTLLIIPKDKYFKIEIISPYPSIPSTPINRIYKTHLTNDINKIYGNSGYPLEINSDGSINASISNKLISTGLSFMNEYSTSINISNAKNITIYGNSTDGISLSLQTEISNNNNNFYGTQYVYKNSSGGDFGFTLPPISAQYLRLKKVSINGNITTCGINYIQ
jgi:hypothetical protein